MAMLISIDRATLRASVRSWSSPTWYRDRAGPDWLQWVWTLAFNSAIAVGLTLLAWGFARRVDVATMFYWNFVIANCIGFTIHLLFRVGLRFVGADRMDRFTLVQRVLFYAGIPILSVFIGYGLGLTLLGVDVVDVVVTRPRLLLTIIALSLLMSAFWYRSMANKARLLAAEAEREREHSRALAAEKQSVDAQLRALQAQIEPHFLFNTLANVASLIDSGPAQAKVMLARLIDLLRASLDASRATSATLGQELALVRAYLDILSIRMGQRLTYVIDAPEALSELRVPPLLLQPLVENALKHGLEPKVQGGRVEVRAGATATELRLSVADDGLGFVPTSASGVGLSNLRARLAAQFGADAYLAIEERRPGTCVTLVLPLRACVPEAAADAPVSVPPVAHAPLCP